MHASIAQFSHCTRVDDLDIYIGIFPPPHKGQTLPPHKVDGASQFTHRAIQYKAACTHHVPHASFVPLISLLVWYYYILERLIMINLTLRLLFCFNSMVP